MDNGQPGMDGEAYPLAINESVSTVQCFESLRQEFVLAWSDESAAIAEGKIYSNITEEVTCHFR